MPTVDNPGASLSCRGCRRLLDSNGKEAVQLDSIGLECRSRVAFLLLALSMHCRPARCSTANDNHNSMQVAQRRPVIVLVGELPRGVAYAVSVDVDFY